MSSLNKEEVTTLSILGKDIRGCLSCTINDNGIPCRTDRLEAVELMKKYLEIHDYVIVGTMPRDTEEVA
mgnify:CR=1 FL=1